jgi:type IV pilus assembly protein PilC
VHNQIADGESISSSFATVGLFSPLIIRMVSIGETTGEMDVALKNVSYFYTREVTEKIEKIEPAIQPIITVFLGLMVCWIILSVMAPIYDIMLTIG